jgi:hypothetical protein
MTTEMLDRAAVAKPAVVRTALTTQGKGHLTPLLLAVAISLVPAAAIWIAAPMH